MTFLYKDMTFAVQAQSGFYDISEYVTGFTAVHSSDIASRRLADRDYMWHVVTNTMYEGSVDGYVLPSDDTKFTDIFAGFEKVLWMFQYPNKRADAFRAFIPQDSVEDNGGVQEMDIALMPTDGYFSERLVTAAQRAGIALKQGSYLFAYIAEDIPDPQNNVELDCEITDDNSSATWLVNNIPITAGIYLLPIPNLTGDVASVTAVMDLTNGTLGTQVQWNIGELR